MIDKLKKTINEKLESGLEWVEWQDIGDVLVLIEQSFNIELGQEDFTEISTFGALCDLVYDKIELKHQDDCTGQQAFYKLKKALSTIFKIKEEQVTPNTLLTDLMPVKGRIKKVKSLEQILDMKLMLLTPPGWITILLLVTFILSLLAFFLSWTIALSGLAFSIAGFWISGKAGKELSVETVGALVEKMRTEHYLKSRSNPETVNRNELEGVIKSLFAHHLALELSELGREAKFGSV